jgi:hypothetical protein
MQIKKLIKSSLLLLLTGNMLYANAENNSTNGDLYKLPSNYNMIVALYGRPNVKTLGILGQQPIQESIKKAKTKAKEYEDAWGVGKHVTPGFDLIYEMATSSPGRDKKYVITLSDKVLLDYIKIAKENDIVVFIDVQLGKKTPAQAVKPLLKYLKYDNVHIAIDPEFSVDDLTVNPGKKIGSITGPQINEVQDMIKEYIVQNGIKNDKILLVHMFTEHMVTDKKAVRYTDHVHVVMHLDGHGSPALKIKTYNGLYSDIRASKVVGGFKVFYKQDKPIMTPKQVLGIEPVGRYKVRDIPRVITYQ